MSSNYFVKATEHALNVLYTDREGKTHKKLVNRGETFEFNGIFHGASIPPNESVPDQSGQAGGGYTEPAKEEIPVAEEKAPEPVVEPVAEPVVEEKAPEPVVEKKRGRKSNAEKAAEAAAKDDATK